MNSKERFTSRVDTYKKYRPSYPREAIDYLFHVVGMNSNSEVLDIGAGTGIFSELLLERGTRVTAIEPNEAMREAAIQALGEQTNFRAISGSAEETGLPDHSCDYIVSAQAFHWFDRVAAKKEFHRVLRPGGKAVLIWNTRLTEGTPFLKGYEQLLKEFGVEYTKLNHKNISPEMLAPFFKPDGLHEVRFPNRQMFDLEGLIGRSLSSSYVPEFGHPDHQPMLEALNHLFERNKQDGVVFFDYETELFWGEV
jgi:SAM-dependent methyltransferase